MIDLHCHMLPGLDDGAPDLETSVEMARIAIADGIEATVCTPHVTPGVYDNTTATIFERLDLLQRALREAGIDLQLFIGADIHVSPLMGRKLRSGEWPSVAGTRYFLFEPPHRVMLPNIVRLARSLMAEGYMPILTHPERLSWIEQHYDVITALDEAGCVMQITAGAITGRFGARPQYWARRLLEEGRVDIIATDAHGVRNRPPLLREGYEAAARIVGDEEAWRMVYDNPLLVLNDRPLPGRDRRPRVRRAPAAHSGRGLLARLFGH